MKKRKNLLDIKKIVQTLFVKSKSSRLVILVIALVLILSLMQIIITHNLATLGEDVRALENEADQLEQTRIILTEEINKLSSLSTISIQAEKLGLVRTTQVLHLTPQIPVALK